MKKLFVLFILLLAAIWIGWEMHQNSGHVLISFPHSQIGMGLWTAISLIVALFGVTYVILRLIVRSIQGPRQWRLWRQSSREHHAYELADLAGCELIEEKYESAEKHFCQAAEAIPQALLCYVGAAIAAQAQGANVRRENYLRKALETAPNAEITLTLLQAKLQIEGEQWLDASLTLKKLQSAIPQHPVLKRLLLEVKQS